VAWGIAEPFNAERLSIPVWCTVVLGGALAVRAFARAICSLRRSDANVIAATVGLFRPRIVVSDRLAAVLDSKALAAVYAHEAAHLRHRDPLRIWLARWVTDLAWPSRSALTRFHAWRHALELARDEEAIAPPSPVMGADLAAAILGATRLSLGRMEPVVATLLSDGALLQARVELLLEHDKCPPRARMGARDATSFFLSGVLALWIALGVSAGDEIVERFLLR